MKKYTIYCTTKQTKKAFELGAPLEIGEGKGTVMCKYQNYHTYKRCIIPTAEQMIGWLEEKKVYLESRHTDKKKIHVWVGSFIPHPDGGWTNSYSTIKEATLEAIDKALEYLSKK